MTTNGAHGRRLRVDPFIGISCLVALLVYLLLGFDGPFGRDLGVYTYGGQQVAEGVLPYVSIINRAGPLAHLIPGIGVGAARLIGADDILGVRVLFMLLTVACIGLVYILGRDLFRSRLAGVASAGALLCFHSFIVMAAYGPREKTPMVLFLLAALLAMSHQRWATSGVFISLATLTWQPVFLSAMAAVLVTILIAGHSGRAKALARVVVGGLAPTLLTMGVYAVLGHLDVFLDDFLLINARYTGSHAMLEDPARAWETLVNGYVDSLWVLLVGMVAMLALATASAVALLRRKARPDPMSAGVVGAGVALLVGVLWSNYTYDSGQDAFVILPTSALGIGGLAALLGRRLPARAALAATLAWAVAATAMSVGSAVRAHSDVLDLERESVAAVLDLVPPDARILSIETPQVLVLAHQRNLSRFQLFGNGLTQYLDDVWPGGRTGYAQWVGQREPTLIAIGTNKVPGWLAPTVRHAYRCLGAAPGWVWYVRRDAAVEPVTPIPGVLDTESCAVEG